MKRWTVCISVFAAAFVAGCQVDQEKEVATYRDVVDLPTTQPSSELSLHDALLLTNQGNENLSIEGEVYLRTIISRRRAVANFLPTVNLAPTYVFREHVDSGDDDGGGSSAQDEFLDVPADMSINLFNGFRDVNRYWRDTFLIERQRNLFLAAQQSLLLDTVLVYYQTLRSEASVRVLENSLKVQEERLRDTRARFDAGVARSLDVSQTEAQVSGTRITLIRAKRDVYNARTLLALVTNAPVQHSVLTDGYTLPEPIAPLADYVDLADQNRSELQAAEKAIEAARREVEVAFGQYYPSVTLDFSVFLYRESVPDERLWAGLLSANLPIFSAGRIEADVREAWSFLREALLARSLIHRQVLQEVDSAHQDLIASHARLEELKVAMRAATQAFDQAEQSYQAGLATNLDRITAQDALLEAQLAQASEEFDRKIFHLRLLRTSGILRQTVENPSPSTNPATQPATQPSVTPHSQ